MSHHVLSLLVEDKPGLLTRVAGLFARRGFNIISLAVGTTEVPGLSRITVVVDDLSHGDSFVFVRMFVVARCSRVRSRLRRGRP